MGEVGDYTGQIDGTGVKSAQTQPKPSLTLIPPTFIIGVTEVLDFGAKKYARGNWMKGIPFSQVLDAMGRHMKAIELGEDLDPETGLPHIHHLGCEAAFYSWFAHGPRAAEYAQLDDRLFKVPSHAAR